MVTTGADHSMMDRSLMILENEHAPLEDKQTACENLERYFNQLLQTKTDLTPLKTHSIKVVKILLQYVEQEGEHKLTIPALTALRPAVEVIAKNVSFAAGMKLASLCYEALLKSYRTCDTSCQAGILVEMFRCMAKFNDAQFFEAITSRKTPYTELKEVCESFMIPSISSQEMDLNQQAVRLEALRFLKRFLRVAGGAMLTQIEQEMCYWVDLLLQHMFIIFKENNKVGYREMEVSIRQEAKEALELLLSKMTPGAQLRSEKWLQIKKDIRDVYADIMVKMVGTCPEWSEHWILVLQLLDKELITKGNNHLINRLLMVEERAFKFDKAEVRIVAFTCWCHLIDKFIPEHCENYRESVVRSVRLLMQPLQANNARTEAIALQKLYTWWHLMHSLESCPEVLVATVLSPFLTFCFGSPKLKDQCPGKRFLSLHIPSAQSLVYILDDRPENDLDRIAEEIVLQSTKQKIIPFKKPLLNSLSLFLDVSEEVTFCVGECIAVLSSGNYEGSKELIQKMWQFLLAHIQKVLKNSSEHGVKVVQDLLRLLRQLTERETSTMVLFDYYLNILLEDVVKGSKALPDDVLCAPMYYVGNGPRFMAGTPALLLVECMMSEHLLPLIKTNTRYVSLLKYLVNFGIDHCNTLDFIQAVMKNMETLNCSLEEMCLLWNIMASACIKYLKCGGQVNQGSDHQPDFTCFYAILMFPLQHICSISYSQACEVVLMWHELYKLFCVVVKSTVTNLDAVEIQETVACKLNQILIKNSPKAAKEAIAILKVTQDIVNSVPFSEIFGHHPQPKRRGRASCGISNVLNLVMKMPRLLVTFERVEEFFNTSWALLAIIIDIMYKNLKQTSATVAMPVAWQLSDSVSALLQVQVVHDGTSRFCSDSILRMWKDYLRFMETSLTKKSLKEAISWLCSLLEFGFKNTLLEVRTITVEFWDNCLYPACHKEGIFISKELQELREKCGNTVARHSLVVADSEDDNASDVQRFSSSEGRANKENICNSETVVKQTNDAVFAVPEAVIKAKTKSLVQQLKDDGHVLTRHQKEILRSKKDDIPALYSSTLQPEQDSQYSQNSESSQDILEFTGPSRILEPVVEETIPTPDRSLKVLEPPSSQRRLAEYRKKMMIDDEGSIILAAVTTSKQPEPVSSSIKNGNEGSQMSSENCNTLNNRKLNLESVAVPMLNTVLSSNSSEVRLSSMQTTDVTKTGSFPVENNVELDSERNLLMPPNSLQHLVKSNRDTLPENRVINAPVLLQNYADFPSVQFVNTAPPKTDVTAGPATQLTAEQNSPKSIPEEKENKSSINYFKAVSIALVDDDDDEEEEDDNVEMLNISVDHKCDNSATSNARASLEQCNNVMRIQKTNPDTQSDVEAVKVVVEKVEDFSLNKTFAALETIVASTFDSAELQHISTQTSDICSPNNENTRNSANKPKTKAIPKDPVELDLQKLFEVESQSSADEQKSSPHKVQKPVQRNPRSRSGRNRSKKDATDSATISTTSISPSLIIGSKIEHDKLTADLSKSNKVSCNTVDSPNMGQSSEEKEVIAVKEANKEETSVLLEIEVEASLTDNSLLNSLSDVPISAELVKDGDDSIKNKSEMAAPKCDSKVLKSSNPKKTPASHDKEKEKPPVEKRKRKRSSSVVKENTEQKTKRPRRSKLSSKTISTGDSEVPMSDRDKTNKAFSEHPVFSISKNNPLAESDTAINQNNAVTINSNEKCHFKESKSFEIGKNVLSDTSVKVFGAPEADEKHKLEDIPVELNTSDTEKNSFPHTDNNSSLEGKQVQVTNISTNQKNEITLKPKSKLSKKGGAIGTAKKKDGKVLTPLRKLRSAAKGNALCGIPSSLKADKTVKVSEDIAAETESNSPSSQTVSDVETKDISVQKPTSNKTSKDEIEIANKSTKEKEQEPSESQDVIESSQSNTSPSIFSWNSLKTCSVVVRKLDTSLEPGSKVNLDENLVLIKTPDDLSPYKVYNQQLDSIAPAMSNPDNGRLANTVDKAKKNLKNVEGFLDVKLNSGSPEDDEVIKSVPKPATDLSSTAISKEKGEAFDIKKDGNSPVKKSKSSVTSDDELSATETCKIKVTPAEDIPQVKSKKAYIQTLITEVISSAHERKEKLEVTSSTREGVKTRHQKVVSHASAKAEGQSTEKVCLLGEESSKAKSQASKTVMEENNKAKSQASKPVAQENSKAKSQTSRSVIEETSKTKSQASKSVMEGNSKAKSQASKSVSEESSKTKSQTSRSLTEESSKTKSQASKSVTEETCKTKSQASKSVMEETSKTKSQTSNSVTEETNKAKSQASKTVTEENSKTKTQTPKSPTKSHSEIAQTKLDTIENIEKDHNCQRQEVSAHPVSSPKSQIEIHSLTKDVAVIQSCNKKAVPEAADNSNNKEIIKPQSGSSKPLPLDIEMKSMEEAVAVKKKQPSMEVETSKSLITVSESVNEQVDNGKEFGHVETEDMEAGLKQSEQEKTSKLRKPKHQTSTSEAENVVSVEEIIKSKADKSRTKMLENKLLNEGSLRSKRKQKPVIVSVVDKLEKSTELATSDDASLLNFEESELDSCNKVLEENNSIVPSDSADKEKSNTTTSSQTKEKSAKLKKNSLRLSKTKSCSSSDASDVPNSESASENDIVLHSVNGDHAETSSKSVPESNKVTESSMISTDKEDATKDKASLGEEIDATSQGVNDWETAIATVTPSTPQSEKKMNVSDSSTGKRKRRGRPPNLNIKRLFPLSRKRSVTKESPCKVSMNDSEITPKSPKMRRLFNTDGHEDLIITPNVTLQGDTTDTTEASSVPTSLPLSSTENTSPPASSSVEGSSVPATTAGESPLRAVQTSPSNQTSPSTLPSSPSISAVTSLASCPLPDVASSETSPPKAAMPKTSSPKLSSPKSLLNSPSSLLKAFSSSPSTTEPKHSRIGQHATLTGRAQFMVGLALVSKEGKSATESSVKHDSSPALFSTSLSENASIECPMEKQTAELTSTPVKRRSLLIDPKRRLNTKKKRVSFSETPQTILYECHANEKKRIPSKNSKSASIKNSGDPSMKKSRLRSDVDHETSDDEIIILNSDSEGATSSHTIQEADSPDLSGLSSQGSVQEARTELLSSQQPIFPQLSNCNHPVEAVVAQLTNHPMWTKAFLNEMYQRNIRTIGDLSRCDEVTINRLPIPVPKVAHTKKVLQDYQRTLSLLPRRGFWHSVGSRLLEQEAPPSENLVQCMNVTDCAKFIANNPKSLHSILEEAIKMPHAQEKLKKEIQSLREGLVGSGTEMDSQQQLDKMAEYVLSHREQFLNKIPVTDLCKYLAMRSPEETEKWILECLRTYLRAGSFSFLEKLGSPDDSVDLLNIIQSYIMVKRPIAEILEGMPKDSVLHFAMSKLTLADKMVMCAESLVTDNSSTTPAQLQKLLNAIVTKMKMSGVLDLISHMITEKLKSMDL